MQIFTTNKKLYLANECKSWLWTFVFAALGYFGLKLFPSITNGTAIAGVSVILMLKLGDTLTQYHVTAIQIDNQKQQITFVLKSLMTGSRVKNYPLKEVTSEIVTSRGLTKYLSSPFSLKIFLQPKDTFVISNKYGFSLETLARVDSVLKSIATQS